VSSIEEDEVGAMLGILSKTDQDRYWVWLDEDSNIIDGSESFAGLIGETRSSIKGMAPKGMVVPEEEELMRLRAKMRKEDMKSIYYFTRLKNGRLVIVYSFPILRDKKYVGAIGILKPIDEIESDLLLPQAIQQESAAFSEPLSP
jgi:PAS domain S-box-containing protein